MNLNTSLSPDQARFALLLEKFRPEVQSLWDMQERSFKPESVEKYLSTCSPSEGIMVKFLLGVWGYDEEYDFNLFQAIRLLDSKSANIIKDWVNDPFRP